MKSGAGKSTVLAVLAVVCISCSEPPRSTPSILPEPPSPPPRDHVAEMRSELRSIQESTGDARSVAAEKFYNRVRMYRGDPGTPASDDLKSLAPSIVDVLKQDQNAPSVRQRLGLSLGLCQNPATVPALIELVESERDRDTQAVLLDALGITQDARCIPTLVRFCGSGDPILRKFAVFNVSSLKDESVRPLLREKLSDASEEVRWVAAFGLGHFHKDKSGFEILLRMLNRDSLLRTIDPKNPAAEILVQRTILLAIKALQTLADRRAIEPLRVAIRTDPSDTVKEACRETIRLLESPR